MAGSARRWSGATKPLSPHTPISEHHGEQESHSMRPRGPLVTNEPSRNHTLDHRRGFIVLAPLAVAALLFLPGIGQRILYSGDEARYSPPARNMDGAGRRLPMALFWLCLGLGYSAKGPAGLMPLLPCAVFLVMEHGWRGLGRLRPLMGVAIVALVSAPWALAFALQRDESYVQSVLLGD